MPHVNQELNTQVFEFGDRSPQQAFGFVVCPQLSPKPGFQPTLQKTASGVAWRSGAQTKNLTCAQDVTTAPIVHIDMLSCLIDSMENVAAIKEVTSFDRRSIEKADDTQCAQKLSS